MSSKFSSLEEFKYKNKLLLIRRKDSIGYTDFIRGKYNNLPSLT